MGRLTQIRGTLLDINQAVQEVVVKAVVQGSRSAGVDRSRGENAGFVRNRLPQTFAIAKCQSELLELDIQKVRLTLHSRTRSHSRTRIAKKGCSDTGQTIESDTIDSRSEEQ